MAKLGIESLSAMIVAVLNIVRDVRESLPKFGLEDIGRLWDAIRNSKVLFNNWREAVNEARDLDQVETAALGVLVETKLLAQGIVVDNVDLIVEKVLNLMDTILELIALFPNKKAENDSTKAAEPGA